MRSPRLSSFFFSTTPSVLQIVNLGESIAGHRGKTNKSTENGNIAIAISELCISQKLVF